MDTAMEHMVTLDDVLAAVTAVLTEQRRIVELLEGLQPNDAAIGEMAQRYNAKMAVIKGGV